MHSASYKIWTHIEGERLFYFSDSDYVVGSIDFMGGHKVDFVTVTVPIRAMLQLLIGCIITRGRFIVCTSLDLLYDFLSIVIICDGTMWPGSQVASSIFP